MIWFELLNLNERDLPIKDAWSTVSTRVLNFKLTDVADPDVGATNIKDASKNEREKG